MLLDKELVWVLLTFVHKLSVNDNVEWNKFKTIWLRIFEFWMIKVVFFVFKNVPKFKKKIYIKIFWRIVHFLFLSLINVTTYNSCSFFLHLTPRPPRLYILRPTNYPGLRVVNTDAKGRRKLKAKETSFLIASTNGMVERNAFFTTKERALHVEMWKEERLLITIDCGQRIEGGIGCHVDA